MGRYAENTSVPVDRSEAEIKRLVMRHGASSFVSGEERGRAMLVFAMAGRRVRFILPIPDRADDNFRLTPGRRRERSTNQQYQAWEQACRSRWRALLLTIKAKLEAIETGITTFDDEFLAHFLLPDGKTIGERLLPKLTAICSTGKMPPLLPHLDDNEK